MYSSISYILSIIEHHRDEKKRSDIRKERDFTIHYFRECSFYLKEDANRFTEASSIFKWQRSELLPGKGGLE